MLWLGTTVADLGQLLRAEERTGASACRQESEAESTGTQAASGTLSTIQATITRRAGATASSTEGVRIACLTTRRKQLRRRGEALRDLSPEQRARLRRFHQRWENLPPERRRRIAQRLRRLQNLPPLERERAMDTMPFWRGLDPDERRAVLDFIERLPHSN